MATATMPTRITETQEYMLHEWWRAKQSLEDWQKQERELRQQVIEQFWSKPVDSGSQTVPITSPAFTNFKLEMSKPLNYSVDGQLIDELEAFCQAYGIEGLLDGENGLFRYKAECSVTFFHNVLPVLEANMSGEVKKAFQQLIARIITIKPGSPSVKLTAAK